MQLLVDHYPADTDDYSDDSYQAYPNLRSSGIIGAPYQRLDTSTGEVITDDSAGDDITDPAVFNRRPEPDLVDSFLNRSTFVTEEDGVVSTLGKHGINWLSPNDYVANWSSLDEKMRSVFHTLLRADSSETNRCYYGLKEHDSLPEHLLLLMGAEIWNICPSRHTDMVSANLKFNNLYSPTMVSSRILDARTAMVAINNFEKTFNPAVMFKDFDASILLIDAPDRLREIRDNSDAVRDAYMVLFQENSAFFRAQTNKGKIFSFIYSHEISVTSILKRQFCPHTHALVFYPKGTELPLAEMQADLARKFTDRKLTIDTTGGREGIHSTYTSVENFCKYLYKVSTLARTYRREFSYDNAREINLNTIHCLRTLVELSTGTGDVKKRFQQTGCVQIAKCCDKGSKYVHPRTKALQKRLKTIERRKANALRKQQRADAKKKARHAAPDGAAKTDDHKNPADISGFEGAESRPIRRPSRSKCLVFGNGGPRRSMNRARVGPPRHVPRKTGLSREDGVMERRPLALRACSWSRAGPEQPHNNQQHRWTTVSDVIHRIDHHNQKQQTKENRIICKQHTKKTGTRLRFQPVYIRQYYDASQ